MSSSVPTSGSPMSESDLRLVGNIRHKKHFSFFLNHTLSHFLSFWITHFLPQTIVGQVRLGLAEVEDVVAPLLLDPRPPPLLLLPFLLILSFGRVLLQPGKKRVAHVYGWGEKWEGAKDEEEERKRMGRRKNMRRSMRRWKLREKEWEGGKCSVPW